MPIRPHGPDAFHTDIHRDIRMDQHVDEPAVPGGHFRPHRLGASAYGPPDLVLISVMIGEPAKDVYVYITEYYPSTILLYVDQSSHCRMLFWTNEIRTL